MYQSPSTMDSVAELSSRLQQHTLEAHRHHLATREAPAFSPPVSDSEPPTSTLRTRRRRSSSLLICQQRQAMTRRQCTPAHLSHIAALVEEMSQHSNGPDFDAAHPSSTYRAPVSPTSNPCSFTSLDSTPSSSGSEDCGSENACISSRIFASKVGKGWRKESPTHALGREQKLVLKKIRMRKSLGRLKTAA